MDNIDKSLIKLISATVIGVMCIFYLIGWMGVGLPIGQTYTTVGVVEFYEQSSWCGEHTRVVLKTVGGAEADITLVGYHVFEIGDTYKITTVCERGGFLGLSNWFKVI